jgi:hypothetical protein
MLLELAIWKSRFKDLLSPNTERSKMQSRVESLSMVAIIVSNVMSIFGGDIDVIYGGEETRKIPRDVTHVRVHSSIKAIKSQAFLRCSQLSIVNLGDIS